MAKLPTIKEMAEKVAKEALEKIYTEKPELKEIKEAYEQGRADEREAILGLVDWKAEQDVFKRKIDIHIDFAEILTTENVLKIITEQLKQLEEQQK